MKKTLLSAALILLLMLCLSPAAYADVVYPPPDPLDLGEELDHLAAETDPGAEVSLIEGALPEGVELETEQEDGVQYVYLRGTPEEAGTFNFVISTGDANSFFCSVVVNTVRPSPPRLTASSDVFCSAGDEVRIGVAAAAEDDDELSYQWYACAGRDSLGGIELSGATGPDYSPSTSYPGTTYYYCVVTVLRDGEESDPAASPAIAVTVEAVSAESIQVETPPIVTDYEVGDEVDTDGLQIRVFYSNGDQEVLSGGFEVSPLRLNRAGEQTVKVRYEDLTDSFTVSVREREQLIRGIGILSYPKKTTYTVGETLAPEGLSVQVYYDDDSLAAVYSDELVCEPMKLDKAGRQTITVRYGEESCTFDVTVEENDRASGIEVWKMPDKVNYGVGDTLDTAGMVLRVRNAQGETRDVSSGFSCTPSRFTAPGRQEVVVRYEDLTVSFHVTVAESGSPASSPSPAPSASPGVQDLTQVSPAPSAAPQVTPRVTPPSHRSPVPPVRHRPLSGGRDRGGGPAGSGGPGRLRVRDEPRRRGRGGGEAPEALPAPSAQALRSVSSDGENALPIGVFFRKTLDTAAQNMVLSIS